MARTGHPPISRVSRHVYHTTWVLLYPTQTVNQRVADSCRWEMYMRHDPVSHCSFSRL
jgi:hypothetical protein